GPELALVASCACRFGREARLRMRRQRAILPNDAELVAVDLAKLGQDRLGLRAKRALIIAELDDGDGGGLGAAERGVAGKGDVAGGVFFLSVFPRCFGARIGEDAIV